MVSENLEWLVNIHGDVFPPEFHRWLEDNEHVYLLFRALADRLWLRGRKRYSAYTLREKMRFDHDISEVNTAFKISNNITPSLARLYVLEHPLRVGLFQFKQTKTGVDFVDYMKRMFPEVAGLYADKAQD